MAVLILLVGLALAGNLSINTVNASTDVNGIINSDTTWTKAGSPYELQGPVAVNHGVTLTIEPGTTVNINGYYLQVNGTIVARGTDLDQININGGCIVITPLATSWEEKTGKGSIIEKVNFPTNLTDSFVQLEIDSCSLKIIGTTAYSVNLSNSSSLISGNQITQLTAQGSSNISHNELVGLTISGSPLVSDNLIRGSLSSSEGNALIVSNTILGGLAAGIGSPIIWNNTIRNAPQVTSVYSIVGISSSPDGCAVFSNNRIEGVTIPPHPIVYSINIYTGESLMTMSETFYNVIGIEVGRNTVVSNNFINGCSQASIVVIDNNVNIENNTLNSTGLIIKPSENLTVKYNNIDGGVTLSQGTSANVDAAYNWWGTTDTSTIDASIFDFKEDFNLGNVTYLPLLFSPNQQAMPDPNAPIPTQVPSAAPLPSNNPTFVSQVALVALVGIIAFLLIAVILFLRKRSLKSQSAIYN